MGNVLITGKLVTDRTTVKEIAIDPSGGLLAVTLQHSKVHQGDYYTAAHYFSGVASGGVALLRLKTSSSYTNHAVVKVACGADAKAEVIEGTTYTADGTVAPIYNQNRSSSKTTSSLAYHTPTIDTIGTVILPEFLPGGSGGNSIGSASDVQAEQFVYASDTDYLIRVTNNGAGAEDISIMVSFYEVPV